MKIECSIKTDESMIELLSVPHRDGLGPGNFSLQLQQSVNEGLGRGRAPRHVDVDWYNSVHPSYH